MKVESHSGNAGPHRRGAPTWVIVTIAVVGLPAVLFLLVWVLISVTNNLDLAFALGVSETVLNASLVAVTGLIVGLGAAATAALRRWRIVAPPLAGVAAGLGIYLLLAEFAPGQRFDSGATETLITTMASQALAIILATRRKGSTPS